MDKQLIKAKLIKSLPAGVKGVAHKHKFLHASLLAGVRFYEDDAGLEYIAFFDSVVFAEKGAWVYSKVGDNHLDRFVLLYLLAQAYNSHSKPNKKAATNPGKLHFGCLARWWG